MNKESIKSVVISVFFSEFTALFFLVIAALFSYTKEDPSKYSSWTGIAGLMLGALACGVISTLITKRKSQTVPLVSGGVYCIVQIICAIIWSDNNFDLVSILTKLVLAMGICFLTSYFLKEKRRKNKRHKASSRK